MKLLKILKNLKPLFFVDKGLILSNRNFIFLRTESGSLEHLVSLPVTILGFLLDRIPLLYRLRRGGVYSAESYKDDYYFCHGRKLFRFNHLDRTLVVEKVFSRGRGPLKFCVIENLEGFEDGIYFGEYFENPDLSAVKIYIRSSTGEWVVWHEFDAGSINHIHALIPDRHRDCIWILTGDFGKSSCLWIARNNFCNVVAVDDGRQIYRACVAFPLKWGLLYATDTQFEPNSIRMLEERDGKWVSRELKSTNGPAIYGCEVEDYFIFSTSSEPGEEKLNFLENLIDSAPGPGISKNESTIVACSRSDLSIRELRVNKKDAYPFRLFQFCSVMFPVGMSSGNVLYAFHTASKENGNSTEIWQL